MCIVCIKLEDKLLYTEQRIPDKITIQLASVGLAIPCIPNMLLYLKLNTYYSNYLDRASITVYNSATVPLLISRIPHCHYFSSVGMEYIMIIKDLMGVVRPVHGI